MEGYCLSKSSRILSKEHILLHTANDDDEYEHVQVGYVITPIKLRCTIYGEIVKGIKVMKTHECRTEYGKDEIWVQTDEFVALKIDRRQSMKRLHNENSIMTNPENPWKEIAALQLLGSDGVHPNVIRLLGAFVDDECLYEVMPYYSDGNLGEFMRHHPHGISETQARPIFKQIISGLYYIHSHGVSHHDISADNCMLDNSRCILIDFGMSLRIPHSFPDGGAADDVTDASIGTVRRLIHSQNHCGKLRFMAPEIYAKSYAFDGMAADIWSTGVILFLMVTGRHPYERPAMNDSGYYDLLNERFYWDIHAVNPLISWGREISCELVDLLKRMLKSDERERATLAQVLNHRWINPSA